MEKMSVWRCHCGQVFNGNGSLMRDMGAFWHLVRDGEKYRGAGPFALTWKPPRLCVKSTSAVG